MQRSDSKRICLVGPTYPFRGGIAHHTTLLARHLRTMGHEVLFISFKRQYPRLLFRRDDTDPSQRPITAEAEFLIDSVNPLTWRRTLRRIGEWRPELMIMPWWVPFWAPVWAYLARGLKRLVPQPQLLFICHNVLPHERSAIDGWALRLGLGGGDGYLAHAEAQGEQLRGLFPQRPIKVTPLPTFAELGQEATTLPLKLPDNMPVALFCGLVRPYKGLDVLLAAAAQVVGERPFHLAIVGEFWEAEALYREQIARLGLQEHTTVVNAYVPDEELAAYMQAANVVVLPYRSATQSAVLQLALGHGVPVITTAVGGLPEVIHHQRTGLIVPPGDAVALAAALKCYFEEGLEDAFRQQIAADQDRFAWYHYVENLLSLADG